jgi:NADPH:quinone reductase-like Zn-dependent oxidoreductase
LLEAGKLKPVIDRCYPLEQTTEAHRYADTGRKRGSVVITIAEQEDSSHG